MHAGQRPQSNLLAAPILCRPYEITLPARSISYPAANILGRALPISGRNTNVKLVEPPSCSSASTIVFIGKNKGGRWVAQEQNGLYGGLFVNRAQALKYALFENGHHPEMVVELSREIELDMGATPPASDPFAANTPPRRE